MESLYKDEAIPLIYYDMKTQSNEYFKAFYNFIRT